jgi:hypothetical protein
VRIITRRTFSGCPCGVSASEVKEETGGVLASTGATCMLGRDWDSAPFGRFDTLTLHSSLTRRNLLHGVKQPLGFAEWLGASSGPSAGEAPVAPQ